MNYLRKICVLTFLFILTGFSLEPGAEPVIVDLAVGESYVFELKDGSKKPITVLSSREERDPFRNAIRRAEVDVDVDGVKATIPVALYNLPQVVNGVKLDAAVTKGYPQNSSSPQIWALAPDADVRLRFWNPDEPLLSPGTFVYPLKQRWFASDTQMANDPAMWMVERTPTKSIYYHYDLDFGGYDHLTSGCRYGWDGGFCRR